jgi:hypothetical protein
MNPLLNLTRKVSNGISLVSPSDYILSVDTTNGSSTIILPSKERLSSLQSGNYINRLGSFTIYDISGKLNTNPIQILAPDDDTLINGQSSIWLTAPFAKIDVTFDGVSYNAITFGNNELDFIISKEKLATMNIGNPVVLLNNPDPTQYLKIDYAALAILAGSASTYNGTALRFGYKSIGGDIISITEDVFITGGAERVMNNKPSVKNEVMSFIIGSSPIIGNIYEARQEFIANTLSPSTLLGASLVAWVDTPPTAGNSINSRLKVSWKWYQPLKIKITF